MFRSFNFNYAKRSSEEFQLKFVSSGEDKVGFGFEQDFNFSDGVGDIPLYTGYERKSQGFPVRLCKMDDSGNLKNFNDRELNSITRWLFQSTPQPLISNDCLTKVYYGYFKKATRFENGLRQGYIDLDFVMSMPYAQSSIVTDYWIVNGEKTIYLNNNSSLDDMIYFDVEIEMCGDCRKFELYNRDLNESTVLDNLDLNEEFKIIGDDIRDVICTKDIKKNLFGKFNKTFPRIRYGTNKIVLKGNFKIKIIYQIPLGL